MAPNLMTDEDCCGKKVHDKKGCDTDACEHLYVTWTVTVDRIPTGGGGRGRICLLNGESGSAQNGTAQECAGGHCVNECDMSE